jgi:hypothetical protein
MKFTEAPEVTDWLWGCEKITGGWLVNPWMLSTLTSREIASTPALGWPKLNTLNSREMASISAEGVPKLKTLISREMASRLVEVWPNAPSSNKSTASIEIQPHLFAKLRCAVSQGCNTPSSEGAWTACRLRPGKPADWGSGLRCVMTEFT